MSARALLDRGALDVVVIVLLNVAAGAPGVAPSATLVRRVGVFLFSSSWTYSRFRTSSPRCIALYRLGT